MRKTFVIMAFGSALYFAGGAVLASERPSEDAIAKIDALLAEMKCEVDPDNIEMEDGNYDLDDVQCEDGQYDIMLDADFTVIKTRKE